MNITWPLRHVDHNREYYLAQHHLYLDDLKELSQLREDADTANETERYDLLIEGCQRVMQYIQGRIES